MLGKVIFLAAAGSAFEMRDFGMNRLVLRLLVALLAGFCSSGLSQAQQAPRPKTADGAWVGRWYTGRSNVCAGQRGASEGLLVYTPKTMSGYENECDIERITLVGRGVELVTKCSGEGTISREREYLEVIGGKLRRTVHVGRERQTFTYTRCPD